jgi:DNA invertase Pin-like site-specific DNA recombinase
MASSDAPTALTTPQRVALYVRMSTIAQALSPRLQEAYLRRYAEAHTMRVVRVYADVGCSGLVLAGRAGMQRLLADIAAGPVDFSALLVYDVSRWGRYQDGDEAGFYEFICRKAGIRLEYCAENFDNDGAPMSQLLKSLKRSMAAEYSRELSAKVVAAQRRLALLGFKQGGAVTYGLRRIAVSADGLVVREMAVGERKPRPTDRVLLAPGDPGQIAVVRRIFRLYNREGWTMAAISRQLNVEGVPSGGAGWTEYRVSGVLGGEQYWGNLVYNRRSARMKAPRVRNSAEIWLRKEGALEAIVPPAAGALAGRVRRMRNGDDPEAVLDAMRAIHSQHGALTLRQLASVPGMPGVRRLARMFGSVPAAYAQAGLSGVRETRTVVALADLRSMVYKLRDEVRTRVESAGGQAHFIDGIWNQLRLNGGLTLRLSVLTCRRISNQQFRWRLAVHGGRATDFVLAGLLDQDNRYIERYALVAAAEEMRKIVHFGSGRYAKSRPLLYPNLDLVFGLQSAGMDGGL